MSTRKGLPGLRPIREALNLSQDDVGAACRPKRRNEDYIRHIENGIRDCSQQLQREISEALHCTVSDLHGVPSEEDLRRIKRNYHLAQAEKAGAA